MEDSSFDAIIIGTGLAESIAAAALSKSGFKVAHIDENPYYGGNEASISLDELAQWVDSMALSSNPKYTSVSRSPKVPSQTRQYSICISPSIIPSIGPIISSLVSSGVAKYGGFRLLERVGVYHSSGVIKNVPGSKEDVFKSKEISLVDKRRLMRFLKFTAGNFENEKEFEGADKMTFAEYLETVFALKEDLQAALVFALAFSFSPSEPAVPALHRTRRYLLSMGRYGPSPFLVGHYGGAGEISQGFCRASAVCGGVYILGRRITSITHPSTTTSEPGGEPSSKRYSLTLDDFPDTLTSHVIISSASHLPPQLAHLAKHLAGPDVQNNYASSLSVARGIVIVDRGIIFPSAAVPPTVEDDSEENFTDSPEPPKPPAPLDAGVIVFPPSSVLGGSLDRAATVLVTGEGTMSTPRGKWILYISLPLSTTVEASTTAEQILKPYLDAALALTAGPTSSGPTIPSESSSSPMTTSLPEAAPPQPLFTAFYIEHPDASPPPPSDTSTTQPQTYIVRPSLAPASPLPDLPDAAATSAEAVFWETVRIFKDAGIRSKNLGSEEMVSGSEAEEIDSFWPPMEADDESGAED
ncbi:hypothetical protein H0H87_002528 [Tephrocybe sp. NHM501043]|nr:hypothetical protein H0H87_002528 [Tephrocybe sp. NHM501043]